MIQMFKVMKGLDNVEKSSWFQLMDESTRDLRGNVEINRGDQVRKSNIFLKRYRTDIRGKFFTLRAGGHWNTLPANVQNAKSLNAFKNVYDKRCKEQRRTQPT